MPWLSTFLAGVIQTIFNIFIGFLSRRFAIYFAMAGSLIVLYSSLFIAVVLLVKGVVMAVRVSFPPVLAASTYFLPSNLPVILATIVTVRVSIALYRWTLVNLSIISSAVGVRSPSAQI